MPCNDIVFCRFLEALKATSNFTKCTMQQSKKRCVALYQEQEYEELVMEVHFECKQPNILMCNRPTFQCKFYKQCMKDKNIFSFHRMMKLCLNYKGKQLQKMYPTWTKNKTKEILRLGEKYGKDTPCKNKRCNFDDVVLPNKRAIGGNQIGVEGAMPPPRAIAPQQKEVVNLSNVSDDDFILFPKNKKGRNRSVSDLSVSRKNTYAQITTQKKTTLLVC
jgi:hypothetical protein